MISLQMCRDILNKNGKKYSEAEIKIIREELTKLSQTEYDFYKETKRDKASSNLHEGLDRGTGSSWIQLEESGGNT